MTISSNKIEDIMRQYVRSIALSRTGDANDKNRSLKSEPVKDSVTISEDGMKKMRDRFQGDILDYLRSKY